MLLVLQKGVLRLVLQTITSRTSQMPHRKERNRLERYLNKDISFRSIAETLVKRPLNCKVFLNGMDFVPPE